MSDRPEADNRERTDKALVDTTQECMRIVEHLRRIRHRAEAYLLPLAIPAEQPFFDLMSECARLHTQKHGDTK